MVNQTAAKPSPGLYLVATPIGAARDITLRALDLLRGADVIAAEDTRSLRKLLDIHGISLDGRPLVAYHDHSKSAVRARLLQDISAGKSVVYASEAGTPMVADPGYDLARDVIAADLPLVSALGPSAVVTALTLSGLPTDRFFFVGFLPNASGKRKSALREVAAVPGTLVFYESPKRVGAMLRDAAEVLGASRRAVVCRELTKKFEEVLRGTLQELSDACAERPLKGEVVVLVDRGNLPSIDEIDLDSVLIDTLREKSVRDTADEVAANLGLKRRQVYQRALQLTKDGMDET